MGTMAGIKLIKKQLNELKKYKNNPRTDGSAEAVRESIEKFGYINPIIIDKRGVILAGHSRVDALKELGIDAVECILADDLTEEQGKAFRISDNRVAEFSTWNVEMLNSEMEQIGADDWEKFGFKKKDLEALEPPEKCTCPRCGKSFYKVR